MSSQKKPPTKPPKPAKPAKPTNKPKDKASCEKGAAADKPKKQGGCEKDRANCDKPKEEGKAVGDKPKEEGKAVGDKLKDKSCCDKDKGCCDVKDKGCCEKGSGDCKETDVNPAVRCDGQGGGEGCGKQKDQVEGCGKVCDKKDAKSCESVGKCESVGRATGGLVERIEPGDFDFVSRKFREFFAKKGLVEVSTQSTVDILSACEDTQNLAGFTFVDGLEYPLKQTGQMVLEHELLANPKATGFFCHTTSYRFEKHPKPGRHNLIFPMMEFEIHGDLAALIQFERELLEHFGFGKADSFPQGDYLDICKRYGVTELQHEHEQKIKEDFGPTFFLTNFPESTSPFWNMKRADLVAAPTTTTTAVEDGKTSAVTPVRVAKKCDVIMNGIETIGSAERSCDAVEMRSRFYSIMNGEYAETLFKRFGKERVEKELDEFFAHKFITRSGAGIGITRMIKACKAAKLI